MTDILSTHWSMTLNNPTETDLALIRVGYADYCSEIVHTLEVGSDGTPHIQAWVKLQRQQRMSFLRKLFPRAHFKPLLTDEYKENTKAYAQKDDKTTRGKHYHVFHEPVKTLESVCREVGRTWAETQKHFEDKGNWSSWEQIRENIEKDYVAKDFRYAKTFVSATYEKMWKRFGVEMCVNFMNELHTHTHTQEQEEISEVNIPANAQDDCEGESEGEVLEGRNSGACEDDEDYETSSSSETEGYDESGSSSDSSEDA